MRPYKATFFDHCGRELCTNSASNPNNAVKQSFGHMQENRYGAARTVQVWCSDTGVHLAEIVRSVKGVVRATYKYDPHGHEPARLSATAVLKHKG